MIKQRNRFFDVVLFFAVIMTATAAYTVNTDKAHADDVKPSFTFNPPKGNLELLIDSKTGVHQIKSDFPTNVDINVRYEEVSSAVPEKVYVTRTVRDTTTVVKHHPPMRLIAPRLVSVQPQQLTLR